jgi:hypothetical protein
MVINFVFCINKLKYLFAELNRFHAFHQSQNEVECCWSTAKAALLALLTFPNCKVHLPNGAALVPLFSQRCDVCVIWFLHLW